MIPKHVIDCPNKLVFFSEKEALTAAKQKELIHKKEYRVYQCDRCIWFHLTTRVFK